MNNENNHPLNLGGITPPVNDNNLNNNVAPMQPAAAPVIEQPQVAPVVAPVVEPVVVPAPAVQEPVTPVSPAQTPVMPDVAPVMPAPTVAPNLGGDNAMPVVNDTIAVVNPALDGMSSPAPTVSMDQSSNLNNGLNTPNMAATPLMPSADLNAGLGMPSALGAGNGLFASSENPVQTEPNKETVGEVPPAKKQKKPMNKLVFILIIIVLIGAVAFGLFKFLVLTVEKQTVVPKNLVLNINSTLSKDIEVYATLTNVTSANCSIDLSEVNTSVAGTYDYSVTCNEKEYTGSIEVKDDVVLDAVVVDVEKAKNSTVELIAEAFIVSTTKDYVTIEFEDEDLVQEYLSGYGGPHDINIIITDQSGNTITKTAKLTVIVAQYLATNPNEELEEYNATKNILDKLSFGEGNVFIGNATRTYKYTFNDAESYNQYITDAKTSNSFDGNSGEVVTNDEEMTIEVVTTLTQSTLENENDGVFPTDYNSIRALYLAKDYTDKIVTP